MKYARASPAVLSYGRGSVGHSYSHTRRRSAYTVSTLWCFATARHPGYVLGGTHVKILALDPGATTGYAIIEWDKQSPRATLLVSGDLCGIHDLGKMLQYWLESVQAPDLVIYETFRLYAHKAQALVMDDFIAPQVIGVIRYLCVKYMVPTETQSASKGKGVPLSMVAERLDFANREPDSGHQYDACRHALAYILGEYNRRQQDV